MKYTLLQKKDYKLKNKLTINKKIKYIIYGYIVSKLGYSQLKQGTYVCSPTLSIVDKIIPTIVSILFQF